MILSPSTMFQVGDPRCRAFSARGALAVDLLCSNAAEVGLSRMRAACRVAWSPVRLHIRAAWRAASSPARSGARARRGMPAGRSRRIPGQATSPVPSSTRAIPVWKNDFHLGAFIVLQKKVFSGKTCSQLG